MPDYEATYISRYLLWRLPAWESGENLEASLKEASSARKVLDDYIEEGYEDYVRPALEMGRAGERLDAFIGKSDRQIVSLLSSVQSRNDWDGQVDLVFQRGKNWEVSEFLDSLADIRVPPNIDHHFKTSKAAAIWKTRTRLLLEEMAKYLDWIQSRLNGRTPVSLLRDATLLHLGLVWRDVQSSQALVFNRAFTNTFGGWEEIYDSLIFDSLYASLVSESPPKNFADLRRQFRKRAHAEGRLPKRFIAASRAQLDALNLEKPPIFLESGVNATFPLWLLSLINDDAGDVLLYNTVPWLFPLYQKFTFRRQYEFLREMETIVAHNSLFELDTENSEAIPTKIFETSDPKARDLAWFEIATFREIIEVS